MAMKRIHISIDEGHEKWFYEMFPGASISWWINMLLEKSREVMHLSPQEYAKLAAERLKEDLGK